MLSGFPAGRGSVFAATAALAVAMRLSSAGEVTAVTEPRLVLRQNDVVAFVGGESVVQELEQGHLESLLAAASPGKGVKFRNMGWEGDTVFEQPRDLNFPGVPEQLKRVGATVVFCQFGRFESLAGEAGLPAFVAAYERLLDGLAKQTPRIVLVTPPPFERPGDALLPDLSKRNADLTLYAGAINELGKRRGYAVADVSGLRPGAGSLTEDGIRLTPRGLAHQACAVVAALKSEPHSDGAAGAPPKFGEDGRWTDPGMEALRQAIVEKNRLWFDYWRPMNWAFLGGNRTSVPSSRDPNDLNVRIFPGEMEKFVPLIERAEARVEELARAVGAGAER